MRGLIRPPRARRCLCYYLRRNAASRSNVAIPTTSSEASDDCIVGDGAVSYSIPQMYFVNGYCLPLGILHCSVHFASDVVQHQLSSAEWQNSMSNEAAAVAVSRFALLSSHCSCRHPIVSAQYYLSEKVLSSANSWYCSNEAKGLEFTNSKVFFFKLKSIRKKTCLFTALGS